MLRLRRVPAAVFIACYLAAIAWFLLKQIQGDSAHSLAGYFWTWDMYPDYASESSRRLVVGRTRDGSYVQLVPGPDDRFRWGRNADAGRLDLNRHPAHVRAATQKAVRDYSRGDAPWLEHVYVIERYWPSRFNLHESLYASAYGEPNPRRAYFRIVAEASVSDGGDVQWSDDRISGRTTQGAMHSRPSSGG